MLRIKHRPCALQARTPLLSYVSSTVYLKFLRLAGKAVVLAGIVSRLLVGLEWGVTLVLVTLLHLPSERGPP